MNKKLELKEAYAKTLRHCAGLMLLAMAERSAEFDYLDVMTEEPDGSTRELLDAMIDARGSQPTLRRLSHIMSALDMRIKISLESLEASPLASSEEPKRSEGDDDSHPGKVSA